MPRLAVIAGYYVAFFIAVAVVGWWMQGAPAPRPVFDSPVVGYALFLWTWLLAPAAGMVIHELGHYLAARANRMHVESVVVLGFGYDALAERFYRHRPAFPGGYVAADTDYLTEAQHRRFILGGPALNFLVFLIGTLTATAIPTAELQTVWVTFAAANGALAALNMLPFQVEGIPSDGRQLRDVTRSPTDDVWKRLAKKPPLR